MNYTQYEIREGIVFLIELSPALLAPRPELSGETQLFEILASINDLMGQLVMTMKSTGVGIYVYNCREPLAVLLPALKQLLVPGFYRLFRLNSLNLSNMKLLNDMVLDHRQGIRPLDHFFQYEHHDADLLPLIMSKVLDELLDKKTFNRKKVLWFTTNDKPYTKVSTKENLWRIINDFYNYDYFIRPVFLSLDRFNSDLYRDIFLNTNYLKSDDDGAHTRYNGGFYKDSAVFTRPVVSSQIRLSVFRVKEVRRIQFACDLVLGDGSGVAGNFGCSVKGYTLYSHEKVLRDLLLYTKEDTLKKVFTSSDLIADEKTVDFTANEENKSNLRKGFPLAGDETLFLNKDQLEYVTNYIFDHDPDKNHDDENEEEEENDDEDENEQDKTFTPPPYLKLLGFRDIATFQPSYNSAPPLFITPDLADGLNNNSTTGGYKNSFTTFSSLYQSCIKLRKYGVLFGCTKSSAKPALYALYPTRIDNSSKNIENELEFPEGFLLLRLPWLEDVRSLPDYFLKDTENKYEDTKTVFSAELLNNFKQLISQFFYKSYNPADYPNPTLNYFYKILKHDLLQIDLTSDDKNAIKNDVTSMKLSELRSFLVSDPAKVDLMQKLNIKLNELSESLPKRLGEQQESDKKRQKVQAPELDENAILTAWKNDQWNKFTVAQLKGFQLKYKDKIKSATKKQDLIDNITTFLESREVK